MMFGELVTIFGFITVSFGLDSTNLIPEKDINTADIQKALDNINDMKRDILRFYKQWDSLSRRIADQGIGRAMEVCLENHEAECTIEKRRELSTCIKRESKTIHDQVVVIYEQTLRKPWELEFEKLKDILEHPDSHSKETVNETVWTVSTNNFGEESVRYRFYNALVHFQSPPEVYPIDKVYQLCLDRHFTKQINGTINNESR